MAAKLRFFYAVMKAGKSAHLLSANFNYTSDNLRTIIFSPDLDTRSGAGAVKSRNGYEVPSICVGAEFELFSYVEQENAKEPIACIFIDEAQFFSSKHIEELANIVVELNIPVMAYGLKVTSSGVLFEGSKRLIELAQEIEEIKHICHCKSKATMILKYDSNGVLIIGDAAIDPGAEEKYVSVCLKHFLEGDIGPTVKSKLNK